MSKATELINGKRYSMWGGIVDGKDRFIGGKLIDTDADDATTTIKDLTLEPVGDCVIFSIVGEDFTCSTNVQYAGVRANPRGPGLAIACFGGMEFLMEPKP